MDERKTSRGRPKGSGIDDKDTLLKIAAIVAADPDVKRTSAIKQAGVTNPSTIRRLRDKFNAEEAELVAAVKGGTKKRGRPAAKAAAKKEPAPKTAAKATTKAAAKTAAPKSAAPKTTGRAKAAAKKVEKSDPALVRKSAAAPKASAPKAAKPKGRKPAAAAAKAVTKPAAKTEAKVALNGSATNGMASPSVTMTTKSTTEASNPMAGMQFMTAGMESVVSGMVEGQISLYESALKNSPMAAYLRQQAMMIDMALSMMKAQQDWARKSSSARK